MEIDAEAFRALGDPVRAGILGFLLGQGKPVCACDIIAAFGLAQPTVSHHMAILTRAGLVLAEKRGRWMFYALAPRRFEDLAGQLRALAAPLVMA